MSWSPLEISLRLRQAIYETVAASALSTTPRNYVVSPAGEDPLRPFTVTVCTGQCNHPDELRPACETLLRHVRSHLRQGTRQSYHPSNVDEESSYLPESAVDKIFSEKNKNLVFDAIEELTPRHRRGVAAGVSPTTLRECYRKILLILLDLPRKYWSHIRHFTRHPELADKYLPFFSRPSNFPASDDEELWNIFEDAQWRFCAPRLRYTRDHVWGSKWILPFRIISELGRGRSGKIWAIEVDPEYDSLQVRNSSNLASSAGRTSPSQPRTYALKLFHSNGNDFENESHAYTELRASVHASNMHACGVVSYFGSFEHGDSAAIIFERATRNLETLLQTTQPTTDRAIWETWRGTFNLFISLRTLAAMGCERRPEEMFHMWHNDVCPKNTLVFGEPGAAIDIKLADLGLAHFRRIFTEQTTGLDQRGSVVYGAPEVFRWGINSMRGPTPARQNTEVWSVACMMSELAVWITLGPNGVQEYRQRRRNTQENQSHERPGLFHQNGDVSPAVTDMHTDILSSPASRPITRAVIQKLLNHMLCPADVRYDANVLHVIASGILDDHHYERNRQSPDDDDDNNPDDPSDPNGHQRSRPELSSEDDKNRHEDTDSCSGPSHISPPGGPSGRSDGQESEVCLPVQDHNTDEHSGKQPIPSSRMHRRRSESAPTCLFNNPDPFREKSQRDGGHDKIVVHVADGLDPKNLGPDETKGGQSTASANGDAPIVRGVNCGCQKKTSESDNGNLDPETVSNLSASIQRLRTPIPDVKSKTGHRLLKRMSAIPNVVGFPKMEIHPVGPEMKDHEIDQQRQIKQWPREQTRTKRDCQIALTQFWTSELENRTITFLLDNSPSMHEYWGDLVEALDVISYNVKHFAADNKMAIKFTHGDTLATSKIYKRKLGLMGTTSMVTDAKNAKPIDPKYWKESHSSQTDLKRPLGLLIDDCIDDIVTHGTWNAVNNDARSLIYVLTDGNWTADEELVAKVQQLSRDMEHFNAPNATAAIQFIQFGSSEVGYETIQLLVQAPEARKVVDHSMWEELPFPKRSTRHGKVTGGNYFRDILGAILQQDDEDAKLTQSRRYRVMSEPRLL